MQLSVKQLLIEDCGLDWWLAGGGSNGAGSTGVRRWKWPGMKSGDRIVLQVHHQVKSTAIKVDFGWKLVDDETDQQLLGFDQFELIGRRRRFDSNLQAGHELHEAGHKPEGDGQYQDRTHDDQGSPRVRGSLFL